jgi:hypothetical protein
MVIMVMNQTGYKIASMVSQGILPDEITATLAYEFDVSPSVAAKDVDIFLTMLDTKGLLEKIV